MDMTKHKTFRERNLTVLAIVTIASLFLAIIGSFQLAKLPIVAGDTYYAKFSEAGGLRVGDPVQVAGVGVGKVTSIDLEGAAVRVGFTAKKVELGQSTRGEIKTGTLLGARYLQLTPAGAGQLDGGSEIPLERTRAPYNLSDSLSQVAEHTQKLDLDMVAKAIRTFSDTFRDTSAEIGPALEGVTAMSRTISRRDAALRTLFERAEAVTGTFRERTKQISALIQDGNLIMAELIARRDVINRLFVGAQELADQVSGFVKENQTQLRPALAELNKVLRVVNKNSDNIRVAIDRVSRFIVGLGEGVAHGPWFVGTIDGALGPLGYPGLGLDTVDLGTKKGGQ